MPNVELMRLYDTYLGPASDTRLDLGASNFRWDDLYIRGTNSSTTLSSSSANAAVLTATSAHIAGLASTGVTVNSGTITVLTATSGTTTSALQTFLRVNGTSNLSFVLVASGVRISSSNKGLTETVQGDFWYDTTRKTIMAFTNSSRLALNGILFTQTGNGVVANNATEASLIGTGFGSTTLSPNFFVPGKTVRITASGLYETQLVPTTLNIRLRLGGLAGTIIQATGDQTPAGGITNQWWRYITDVTCQTTGATGSVIGQSGWEHQTTATGSPISWAMSNRGVTLDTTTALIVQFTADWGAAVAAEDSMMCTTFVLESLN